MGDTILHALAELALPVIAIVAAGVVFWSTRELIRRRHADLQGSHAVRHLAYIAVGTALLVAVIVGIPESMEKSQLVLGLLGLAFTTVLTLSSTTFLTNAMAGLMLRSVRNFRPGDWISVGDQFGIVTEQGLFHVEIQTENRDLATLPNLYMVTNPVTVARAKGTIASASLSLGYDEPHAKIERLLVRAARITGLESPFVRVMELGNYAVTYRVAGLLKEDVSKLLEVRSRLMVNMLDTLHLAKVEIVSPTFMNQRRISIDEPVMAEPARGPAPDRSDEALEVVFPKAKLVSRKRDLVGRLEALRARRAEAPKEEHAAIDEEMAAAEQAIQQVDHDLEDDANDDTPPRSEPPSEPRA